MELTSEVNSWASSGDIFTSLLCHLLGTVTQDMMSLNLWRVFGAGICKNTRVVEQGGNRTGKTSSSRIEKMR